MPAALSVSAATSLLYCALPARATRALDMMTAAFGTPLGGITTIVEDGDLLISAGPSASNV